MVNEPNTSGTGNDANTEQGSIKKPVPAPPTQEVPNHITAEQIQANAASQTYPLTAILRCKYHTWRWQRSKREKAKLTDRVMSIATVFLALITAGLGIIALLQWRDSGKLTIAAQKAADAADKFKDSASGIMDTLGKLQGNIETMANSSKQSIQATQDAMRLEQRAWVAETGMAMDAPEVGKKISGYVVWSNSGKSFAKKVKPLCHFSFVQNEITNETILTAMASKGTTTGTPSIGVLGPNAQSKTILENLQVTSDIDKARIAGTWYTYIWGEMTYNDIFEQSHTTVFCSYRQGTTADFTQCPFHNDAN
jgi:hypothetical protein